MEKSKHENGDGVTDECANAHACSHWVFSKGWPHCSGCPFDKTRDTASEKSIPRLWFEMMISFAVGSIAGVIAVDAAVHTSVFCPSAQRDYVDQSEREIWQRLWRAKMQRAHMDHMLRQLPPKYDGKK
jgi:hypothetical protein